MSEYGNDFVVLTDEEGNEQEFEHIHTVELNDKTYFILIPAEMVLEQEAEVVILRLDEDENGEEYLASLEDVAEEEEVFGIFLDEYEEEEEE